MTSAAGHTSWSTSGLGYLSLWALGKLRAFDGRGHPWRLLAGLLPLCVSVWIGITRLQARPGTSLTSDDKVTCTNAFATSPYTQHTTCLVQQGRVLPSHLPLPALHAACVCL